MAITMRIGKESDFDPNKMVPGEWAVSTDTRYVRMCFAPGIVMRMATYESFEADMAQIRTILTECKSIQSAIQRIQSEVNAKASITIEHANAAAESAQKAADSEAKAKMYAENAEAVTGIKIATQTTAGIIKGGENYIDESGELQLTKRTDFPTLYNSYAGGIKLNELGGASEQDSTTGAQLIKSYYVSDTTAQYSTVLQIDADLQPSTQYTISFKGTVGNMLYLNENIVDGYVDMTVKNGINSITFTTLDSLSESEYTSGRGWTFLKNARATSKVNVFKDIMLNAGSTALPWEPYTGNAPSPSPEYPQVIKPVEGKNLLDCRGLVEQTVGNATFTPVYDANGNILYININGTPTVDTNITIGTFMCQAGEKYIISGNGKSNKSLAIDTFSDYGSGATFSYSETTKGIVRIYLNANTVYDNEKIYPMIRPASIADDTYVPYGLLRFWGHGTQILNPKYQNITAVTSNGVTFTGSTEKNKTKIKIKGTSTGIYAQKGIWINKQPVLSDKAHIITAFKKGTNSNNITFIIRQYDNSGAQVQENQLNVASGADVASREIVMNATARYFSIIPVLSVSGTVVDAEIELVVAYETVTESKPYTSQSITLSNPIKLNGVGTAQDKIVRKDGVWKIERNVYEIVANSLTEFNTAYGCGYISIPKGTIKTQNWGVAEENAISNIFNSTISINVLINNVDREALGIYTTSAADTREGVIFRITSIEQTEEAYNAFLAETPLVVLVELAQPTYEDLPTADQIALNSLVSYEGITYLYCDSEVQPTWDLEYGTSRVGGYVLEAWNTAMSEKILNEARYNEIVAAMLVMNQE